MGSRMFTGSKASKEHSAKMKEKELMFIKDHPDRMRRKSSVSPEIPAIREERILEDLCDTTDIEPDVSGNNLGKREVQKLIRKISVSDKFTSKFPSEEDFLNHVRRLSDPQGGWGSHANSRKGSLEIPSLKSLDDYIQAIPSE